MPIWNQTPRAYREYWANTQVQLTADNSGVTHYGPFYPDAFTRVIVGIDRTTSVGAQTMDAKLTQMDATGDRVDVLDHAGNAISFVQWADDSHITKRIEVGPGTLSSDADDTITAGTNFKFYNCNVPPEFWVTVTGASGTSDTFTGYIDWMP